ncbi:ribosome biogenesis GTPase Der [bacterium]|nr:ribosome biogenesis GTPase Der [bacterium]
MSNGGLPRVLLVGRTNVGKSAIFNRLSDNARSIVFDREGVTRDCVSDIISWRDSKFELVDTGGFMPLKRSSEIEQRVFEGISEEIDNAAALLMVVDVKSGITSLDMEITKNLKKTKRPLILLVNKADNEDLSSEGIAEFSRFGIDEMIPVSAVHGRGIADLLDVVTDILPIDTKKTEKQETAYRVSIIGKPNVGKSSLLNALIKKNRSIVADEAGTTREPIHEKMALHKTTIDIIDTAGVRRKRSVEDPLEEIMVKSSLFTIRNSDIVVLVIDASAQNLSDQEIKLMFYTNEQRKALILVFNKIDLIKEEDRAQIEHNLSKYEHLTKRLPIIWTSCLTGKQISRVRETIHKVQLRCQQELNKDELEDLVVSEWNSKPMFHKTIRLKIHGVRPVEAKVPSIILYVNYPEWFGSTQLSFLEKVIRKRYDLRGCPIRFILRKAKMFPTS